MTLILVVDQWTETLIGSKHINHAEDAKAIDFYQAQRKEETGRTPDRIIVAGGCTRVMEPQESIPVPADPVRRTGR
ncbi:MAG: hypothetical protein M0Q91_15620 [Methanoregula sp.]|jgi:hypothetical protein|nr:hypothetical protein [Methanoregula sp.]